MSEPVKGAIAKNFVYFVYPTLLRASAMATELRANENAATAQQHLQVHGRNCIWPEVCYKWAAMRCLPDLCRTLQGMMAVAA